MFGPTIRLSGVAISRDALEQHLGHEVSRYEPEKSGQLSYAQLNLPDNDLWTTVMTFVDQTGAKLLALAEAGSISAVSLDLGLSFYETSMATSAVVPAAVAERLGRSGICIVISVYATAANDMA